MEWCRLLGSVGRVIRFRQASTNGTFAVKSGRALKIRSLLALAILGVVVVASGCEPREVGESSLGRLLKPDRERVAIRRLVLPNALKVMLISNPGADRSGAAMSVGVGSLDDPAEAAGMVHFLEHMLFLGTEKYPDPGSYQRFLTSHAGFGNAFRPLFQAFQKIAQ